MNASKTTHMVCLLFAGLSGSTAFAVNIATVPVGNPGNAGDASYPYIGTVVSSIGSVAYTYNIGKYEVTAGQYSEFLNAVAKTDTYGLYNTSMDTAVDLYGCNIKRSGSSGSYTYSVAADWANRPVNFVSWGDSARFANWLHNGQPTGAQNASTTEDGVYDVSATQQYYNPDGSIGNWYELGASLLAVSRKNGAKWAIPSEDEWYKAAYHKNDGITGNYFEYPTSSDSVPSNVLGGPTDPGNNATYCIDGDTIGSPYYRTEVGAHENSDSPYGTFDQGGNVWEWNDAVFSEGSRGLRGGAFFNYSATTLDAWGLYIGEVAIPYSENEGVGFRVVQLPEPATLMMLVLASVGILRRRT